MHADTDKEAKDTDKNTDKNTDKSVVDNNDEDEPDNSSCRFGCLAIKDSEHTLHNIVSPPPGVQGFHEVVPQVDGNCKPSTASLIIPIPIPHSVEH